MNIINYYSEWNTALYKYFFPQGQEDPILFLDETILDRIASDFKIHICPQNQTAKEDFLHKVLLNNNDVKAFCDGWHIATGGYVRRTINNYNDLVKFLIGQQLKDAPASFAVLCALLCVAGQISSTVKHEDIDKIVAHYLNYAPKNIGTFVDDLMFDLNRFNRGFNPNHTACGNQRNMSRIKYQLVLRGSEREDFIDFIEVNNLEWKYGSFTEFVNNILVPALNSTNKTNIVNKLLKEENIPYFKNILLKPLNYGKQISVCDNTIQTKEILWYYELEFDFNGNPTFNIISDYYKPCDIILNEEIFAFGTDDTQDSCVALDIQFSPFERQTLNYNGLTYCFKNISPNWDTIYFECVGNDIYRQTVTLVPGNHYIRMTKRNNLTHFGTPLQLGIKGYTVEEVSNYADTGNNRCVRNRHVLTNDFDLYGVGSYFRIKLDENQMLYWQPDTIEANPQPVNVVGMQNGYTYFNLPRTSSYQISGSIKVVQPRHADYFDHIVVDCPWDGTAQQYYLDGWGEVCTTPLGACIVNTPHRLGTLNNIGGHEPSSATHDMLLHILYDLADSNGCVRQRDMVEAVNFVLEYHGIAYSTNTVKNVIYALKSLGYVISYYDSAHHSYKNQLVAPYLEVTNHSISTIRNAYLVKGTYPKNLFANLLTNIPNKQYIKYLPPYQLSSLEIRPEYSCLPDLVLLEPIDADVTGWRVQNYTTADYLIAIMQNMNDFANAYSIYNGGNVYYPINDLQTPCLVKDRNGKKVLCTKTHQGGYVTHSYHALPHELSKTYCQNQKNQPVCLMSNVGQNRIDYSKVRILNDMGLPNIIDMAFCDLNLGLPEYKEMFVVKVGRVLFAQQSTITLGRIYKTNATDNNHLLLQEAIKKWSGRDVANFTDSSAVFVHHGYKKNTYRMCYERISNHQKRIILYTHNVLGDNVRAFSEGANVYVEVPGTTNYVSVQGSDVNDKLSSVIANTFTQNGQTYQGVIPSINGQKDIEIILN